MPPGGDDGATPAGPTDSPQLATASQPSSQPTTPTFGTRRPEPLPPRSRHGASKEGRATSALGSPDTRYVVPIQDQFIHAFHSAIVPGLVAPSPSPQPIWLTPPSREPCFNSFFMQNALQHLLVSGPGRLRVVKVSCSVFKVLVASQNVANALVVIGVLRLGFVVHLPALVHGRGEACVCKAARDSN